MATCLQVVPMVVPSSSLRSNSSSSSSSFDMNPKIGWRNVSKRRLNYRCSSSKIPLPPVDPNDPFLQRLAAHIEANPDYKPTPNSEHLHDFFQIPSTTSSASARGGGGGGGSHVAQASRGQARYSGQFYGHGKHKTRSPPPDLPSLLFEARIVYLGMPMVDAVTELMIAEFMYLQWVDDTEPIQLYINSSGTTQDDNRIVAHDSNAFAIYDAMTQVKNEVHTVCVSLASGYACLLLAAGKVGRRFALPRSRMAFKVPPIDGTGLMHASKVSSQAREAKFNRDMMFKLFAYNTGHRLDDIKEKLKYPFYMGPKEALEFGVIDKILFQGQEVTVKEDLGLTPEQWDTLSRGKAIWES